MLHAAAVIPTLTLHFFALKNQIKEKSDIQKTLINNRVCLSFKCFKGWYFKKSAFGGVQRRNKKKKNQSFIL